MRIKKINTLLVVVALCLTYSPVCANTAEKVINAKDYGIQEGIDNTPVLIKAMEACKAQNASKLIIPKGTYALYPEKAQGAYRHIPNNDDGIKRIVFLLDGFKDFEIDGQGSKFICHGQMIPFDLKNSRNIKISNLSIDWDKPFFFQAEVVAVHPGQNAFDLAVFKECNYEIHGDELIFTNKKSKGKNDWLKMAPPAQEDVRWEQNINWNIWFDPKTKAPVFNVEEAARLHTWNTKLNKPARAEELGEDLVRLYDATNRLPDVGWVLIIKGNLTKNRLSPAIHVTNCKDIIIENTTVYHSSGIALIVDRTENVTLNKFNVLLPPGSGRLVSSTADATHFVNCRGLIKFDSCIFENMLDDATNVHGIYARVIDAVGDYTLGMGRGHSQQQGFVFAEKGDKIKLLNRLSLEPYATLTVESVKNVNEYYFEATFREKVKGMVQPESVADNISWQPDVDMRNCIVRRNRSRSILISTAGDVVIENNKFLDCTYAGVVVPGFVDSWYESGPVKNVIIRNNLFEDMGLGGGNAPIIDIAANINNKVSPPFYFHKNIIFQNNTINTFGRILVRAKSLENFQFKGNKINKSKNYPVVAHKNSPAFVFDRCKDIIIENNDYNWGNTATIKAYNTIGMIIRKNKNIEQVKRAK